MPSHGGGYTVAERRETMKTYEFKYTRSIGEYIELTEEDGSKRVAEKNLIIRYTAEREAIKKHYEEQGYTEKTSDIIRIMREALQDTPAGERQTVLRTVCDAIK